MRCLIYELELTYILYKIESSRMIIDEPISSEQRTHWSAIMPLLYLFFFFLERYQIINQAHSLFLVFFSRSKADTISSFGKSYEATTSPIKKFGILSEMMTANLQESHLNEVLNIWKKGQGVANLQYALDLYVCIPVYSELTCMFHVVHFLTRISSQYSTKKLNYSECVQTALDDQSKYHGI